MSRDLSLADDLAPCEPVGLNWLEWRCFEAEYRRPCTIITNPSETFFECRTCPRAVRNLLALALLKAVDGTRLHQIGHGPKKYGQIGTTSSFSLKGTDARPLN